VVTWCIRHRVIVGPNYPEHPGMSSCLSASSTPGHGRRTAVDQRQEGRVGVKAPDSSGLQSILSMRSRRSSSPGSSERQLCITGDGDAHRSAIEGVCEGPLSGDTPYAARVHGRISGIRCQTEDTVAAPSIGGGCRRDLTAFSDPARQSAKRAKTSRRWCARASPIREFAEKLIPKNYQCGLQAARGRGSELPFRDLHPAERGSW